MQARPLSMVIFPEVHRTSKWNCTLAQALIHPCVHRCLPHRRVFANPCGSRGPYICCWLLHHRQDPICGGSPAPRACKWRLPWRQPGSAVCTARSSHVYPDLVRPESCGRHDPCSRGRRPCRVSSRQSRRIEDRLQASRTLEPRCLRCARAPSRRWRRVVPECRQHVRILTASDACPLLSAIVPHT